MKLGNLVPHRHRPSALLHDFGELHNEIDRIFSNLWPEVLSVDGLQAGNDLPLKTDLSETGDAYHVTAELPGVEEKDLDVTLENGVLTIRGEKKEEHEEKDKKYHRIERHYGTFVRSLTLPQGIDEEKVTAEIKKGVLTVTVPKSKTAKADTKKIKITAR